MSETFTVGQKVTVVGYRSGPEAITTVSKVGKLKVTLANGQEWKANGRQRWGGSGYSFGHPSLRPYKDSDDAAVARRLDLSHVQSFAYRSIWECLSDAQLRAMVEIIREVGQ